MESRIPDIQQEQMEDMDSLFPDDPGIGLGELEDWDDEDPLDDFYEDDPDPFDGDEDEDDGPDYDSDEGWDDEFPDYPPFN